MARKPTRTLRCMSAYIKMRRFYRAFVEYVPFYILLSRWEHEQVNKKKYCKFCVTHLWGLFYFILFFIYTKCIGKNSRCYISISPDFLENSCSRFFFNFSYPIIPSLLNATVNTTVTLIKGGKMGQNKQQSKKLYMIKMLTSLKFRMM